MPSEPLLAGVDVGTTNIKAVIFAPNGRIVAEASRPTPTHYPQPRQAYYRPDEIWRETVTALRQATAQLDDPGCVVSIAAASMGEAAVPLDAQGRPTYPAIAWFDQRTQPQAEWLAQTIGKDRLFAGSGLSLQPIFGMCKLLWLKENQPDAFARTVRWLNIADYTAFCLSGVPATDVSLASRTLALELRRRRWNEPLIKEVGLSPELFAPLVQSGTVLGTILPDVAAATGLPQHTQVAAGGHDHVCGALAVGVVEPGDMLNSLGTAEAIFFPLNEPVTNPEMGLQGYSQSAHVAPGHYCVFGGLYTSGACVDWWRGIVGTDIDHATLIAEAAAVPPGSLGVGFLPHLRLAHPPHDDPLGRGGFVGLTTDATRGVLFRAVLEGLAFESRTSTEGLLDYPQVTPPRNIYVIGGSTRNHLLMQIKATVLNQPLTVVEITEAVSLGAAMLGGLGAGVYPDVPAALAALDTRHTRVEPNPEHTALYNSYYRQVYRQIYQALRPLNHAIHPLQPSA